MTAITFTPQQNNPFAKLLLFALLLTVAAGALGVTLHSHAVDRHGTDAEAVRHCLNKNGPYMVFKNLSEPTWYLLCQIDKAKWGFQAVSRDGNEKTAFIPGDGAYRTA